MQQSSRQLVEPPAALVADSVPGSGTTAKLGDVQTQNTLAPSNP